MTGPLDGVRVVDFSIWMFGPICTQVLGDFGADVIKVEPLTGEPGRGIDRGHPMVGDFSTRFLSRNRNKRSVCLDLRSERGRDLVHQLTADADVVVQNFRPGVAERLGLSYDELRSNNSDLIYVCGSGYGLTGPYASMGGQDRVAQAMSGFVFGNGDPGTKPFTARTSIMDFVGGMLMTQGVLLALLARATTGEGQRVDLSLLDAGIAANIESFTSYLNAGDPVGQAYDPLMGVYRTADSLIQVVMVFVRHGNPLSLLCEILEIDDLSKDPRFGSRPAMAENAEQLVELLETAFQRRSTDEWLAALRAHDVICSPIYDYEDVASDPQVQANGMVKEFDHPRAGALRLVDQPIRLSATPASIDRLPPEQGEHSDEILSALGLTADEISDLKSAGVVG